MPSLRKLYESIDLERLRHWVTEQQQEDLHLDFKLLSGNGELAKDDRKNLMRAVSGFANGDGGLIVWGVDCRKNDDGVDAAKELRPIENAASVLSQLRDNPSQLTSPIVDGVEHRLVDGERSGVGYLVTLVPPSDRGPHMAGDKHYYKRNGTSFLMMEHFDVADMFGRRQRPDVRLHLTYKKIDGSTGDLHKYQLSARLKNHGRARAHQIKVQLYFPRIALYVNRNETQPIGLRERFEFLELQTACPIFPDDERSAQNLETTYYMDNSLFEKFEEQGWPNVTYRLFQDDVAPVEEMIPFQTLQKF